MTQLGFIGLGIMGSRMAANLLKAGFPITVYNRTPAKARALRDAGAGWADTPAALAEQVDVLFTMLATPNIVEAAAFGEHGFLKALRPGSLWVDSSTVNPTFSKRMAAAANQAGLRMLDAPVAGSKIPAENAQLLFLVGGDAADVEACQPYFKVMSRQVIHAGGHGAGSALKMVFNLLLGQSMIAFAEALVLGESLGLDRDLLFTSLTGSAVAAPIATSKRPKIEAGQYEADFPLQWLQKDLELASLTAYEQRVALPVTNVVKEIYQLANRRGLGTLDISAIYAYLHEANPPEH
jgi:3-hydroxyisobutyrate dehydrogenase/glyoxylate/succinic semialdehyde reductase